MVVYWSPQLKSWNLWENVKTFTARALRLARDYRLPRVGLVLNTKDAAPLVGKAVEGAVLGTLRLRQVQAGEGRLLREGGLAHDPRPPRPPGRRRGAQGPLRLGLRERQPRPRPHQRARQRGDARSRSRPRRARSPARWSSRSRCSTPRRSGRRATAASCGWGRAARTPGRMVDAAPRAPQGLEGDDRPRRQGHHLRLRRHQPEARRQDVGDEGRHGGRRRRALRHARARQDPARREGAWASSAARRTCPTPTRSGRATSSPRRTASR